MIMFSVTKQACYESTFDYGDNLPTDLIEVPDGKHMEIIQKLNEGRYVSKDFTYSDPKPNSRSIWQDGAWFDPETPEEARIRALNECRTLTRRQFMLALMEKGYDDTIGGLIDAIDDVQVKKRLKIEYTESTTFERQSESINQMAQLLGLSEADTNTLWQHAMTL